MTTPTISAVIPTYNRRDHVTRAIESVLSQRPALHEVLVVDDGSTDGTAELLRCTFGTAVRVVEQPNAGVSAARHLGVLEATGAWIAFLDSDDEWTPGRTEAFLATIEAVPADVGWIFGDTKIIEDNIDGKQLFEQYGLKIEHSPLIFENAIDSQYPVQFSLLQSSVIRRSLLLDAGAFSEGLHSSEDFLIGFRAAMSARFAAISGTVTLLYRTSDLEASSLDRVGQNSPDYFRARMIAFDEAATRFGGHWRQLHEEAVRGACMALARDGRSARRVALQQFRHRVSAKAIVFSAAALFGSTLPRLWQSRRPGRSMCTVSD
jgi:glycosyltransferase involved in cell wall biosynthesis